jgi:hypothetical protein
MTLKGIGPCKWPPMAVIARSITSLIFHKSTSHYGLMSLTLNNSNMENAWVPETLRGPKFRLSKRLLEFGKIVGFNKKTCQKAFGEDHESSVEKG